MEHIYRQGNLIYSYNHWMSYLTNLKLEKLQYILLKTYEGFGYSWSLACERTDEHIKSL